MKSECKHVFCFPGSWQNVLGRGSHKHNQELSWWSPNAGGENIGWVNPAMPCKGSHYHRRISLITMPPSQWDVSFDNDAPMQFPHGKEQVDAYRGHVWRRREGIWMCFRLDKLRLWMFVHNLTVRFQTEQILCQWETQEITHSQIRWCWQWLIWVRCFFVYCVPRMPRVKIRIRKYLQIRSRFLCWKLPQSHFEWQQARMLQAMFSI